MISINPYLNFAGNTAEAFTFYKSVFGGDFAGPMLRFRDFGENVMGVPESDMDKIAHVALPIQGQQMLMGSDVPSNQPAPAAGSNFYIMLDAESAEETERVFKALSEGGNVEMPLAKTEWAEKYGMCRDKFGTPWMLNFTGNVNWEDSVK
jgi:PhnB protein